MTLRLWVYGSRHFAELYYFRPQWLSSQCLVLLKPCRWRQYNSPKRRVSHNSTASHLRRPESTDLSVPKISTFIDRLGICRVVRSAHMKKLMLVMLKGRLEHRSFSVRIVSTKWVLLHHPRTLVHLHVLYLFVSAVLSNPGSWFCNGVQRFWCEIQSLSKDTPWHS